jgi:uncharacterized protein YndB with AHSA1/START domain
MDISTPHEPMLTRPAPTTISMDRLLPAPIDTVWSYLIDPDLRAKWLGAGPMGVAIGAPLTLVFRPGDLSGGLDRDGNPVASGTVYHELHGVITRYEPPHVLAFNWQADGKGSECTLELTAEGNQTRLHLTHIRIDSADRRAGTATGWHVHIGILSDVLAGRKPRLFWPENKRLGPDYAKLMAD